MKLTTFIFDKACGRSLALISLVLIIGLLCSSTVFSAASVHSSARSAGMGGAQIGLAAGVDAAKYNPANLGLDGYRKTGFEFVSVGANVTNNAFTLSDYNKYTGAVLSTADKQDIMDKVPEEGLRIDADIRANAASLAFGSYVISINGVGSANANINKDVIDLILNGNRFGDTVSITGSYADGISYGSLDLSFGRPIYQSGSRQLAVGATVRYIKGIAVEQLVEMTGHASTYESGFEGEGLAVVRTATGGRGYGLDLGLALKFKKDYTAGVSFKNVLGKITWNQGTEEHGYLYNFDATTYDDLQEDDFLGSEDYSEKIGSFTTSLPTSLNVGIANTSGQFLWAVDWVQGFENIPGSSTKPMLAAGVEYLPLMFLPLRAGYSVGGNRNASFTFGSGVRFMGFYLDAAVCTGKSVSVHSAKGANFALSTGLLF